MDKKKTQKKKRDLLAYPEREVEFLLEAPPAEVLKIEFVFSKEVEGKKEVVLADYPSFFADYKEVLYTTRNWYVGLGSEEKLDLEGLGELLREVAERAVVKFESVGVVFPERLFSLFSLEKLYALISLAFSLAVYPTDLMKEKPSLEQVKLKRVYVTNVAFRTPDLRGKRQKWARLGVHINAMRQTQALPGNIITSESLTERAQYLAKRYRLRLRVFGKRELEKMGAGGILAVNQGSVREPRMVILEYDPPKAKGVLAFAGKGVTFDTGGISLKPSQDMHEMKYDMSGAAAVLHALAAIAERRLPVRVVGGVGLVENMPSGSAFKPGDVYRSLKGITIEVQNTDAEGRLVLGDVLYYLEKNYKPDLLVDLATLTGACVVALGHFYAGVFSLHEEVRQFLLKVSEKALEPLWPLPVGRLYRDQLKSNIADYNNIAGRPGGASTAAAFLSLFVDKSTRWAHIDIAGPAILGKPFGIYPAPASGYGLRLLYEVAEVYSQEGLSL
ncbi:MAG: leucyl aminopeptidase [Leptospiraceae bacterium]|nr:leucyl aminopeptidase [Leptospiraceae bacterium]MDW8306900.1 leucyl aminopeptidase [Leptospiraceae bacterium]